MDPPGAATQPRAAGRLASAGIGLALGAPAALGVGCLAAADISDPLAALFMFSVYTPVVAVLLAAAGATVVTVLRWPWRAWWWLVAVPPALLVSGLAVADLESTGRVGLAVGWALATLLIYVGLAAALGGRRRG